MKLLNSNIKSTEMYDYSKYPTSGIYLNVDEVDNKVVIYVGIGISLYLGTESEFKQVIFNNMDKTITPIVPNEVNTNISEDFILKLVSITLNKEKHSEL